jgi:hypothetical protein|uniref:Uncharacterized protein n=1 Tax=viral metagenome TaxID=1070528 RepID=A0A6C0IUW4_9ZZZZ
MPPKPYEACTTSREVWDLALRRRIVQLDERMVRYDDVAMDDRLVKLLPGIHERREYYASRLYENLTTRQQSVIDAMKPFGKVWARARSNKDI